MAEFFTRSKMEDLKHEAEQLSICVEHFLYASEHVPEWDWKTRGFYDNCIEKCNGRLKGIHFLMENIRRGKGAERMDPDTGEEIVDD
jgi:hypothetical protein